MPRKRAAIAPRTPRDFWACTPRVRSRKRRFASSCDVNQSRHKRFAVLTSTVIHEFVDKLAAPDPSRRDQHVFKQHQTIQMQPQLSVTNADRLSEFAPRPKRTSPRLIASFASHARQQNHRPASASAASAAAAHPVNGQAPRARARFASRNVGDLHLHGTRSACPGALRGFDGSLGMLMQQGDRVDRGGQIFLVIAACPRALRSRNVRLSAQRFNTASARSSRCALRCMVRMSARLRSCNELLQRALVALQPVYGRASDRATRPPPAPGSD